MNGAQSHIFYLNYSGQLPAHYFHLSRMLTSYGVTLVPVTPKELTALTSPRKQFVLALIPSMAAIGKHMAFRRQYLDFALKTRKFQLFEVSTFAEAEELAPLKRLECYDYTKLPVSLEFLARKLVVAVMSKEFDAKAWPGGKRAKLPAA